MIVWTSEGVVYEIVANMYDTRSTYFSDVQQRQFQK